MSDILSNRLIELKRKHNKLQKDIASGIGIPLTTYQRYEKGLREPTESSLIAIADYFNVSIDYLVGRTDVKEINKG